MSDARSGGSFLALWNGIRDSRLTAEYEAWHTFEHTPERVSVPGFLEARRYRSPGAYPRYFTLYHLTSLSALETPQYQELLAQPTDWSAKMRRELTSLRRVPCQLGGRYGHSMAAYVATVLVTARPGHHRRLEDAIAFQLSATVARADLASAWWGKTVSNLPLNWVQSHRVSADTASLPKDWQYLIVLDATDSSHLRRTARCLVSQLSGVAAFSSHSRFFEFQSRVSSTTRASSAGAWRAPARSDLFEKYHPKETNHEHCKKSIAVT